MKQNKEQNKIRWKKQNKKKELNFVGTDSSFILAGSRPSLNQFQPRYGDLNVEVLCQRAGEQWMTLDIDGHIKKSTVWMPFLICL